MNLDEYKVYPYVPKILEDETVLAGRDGEEFLSALLKKHFNGVFLKRQNAKFYSGKRIPRSEGGRYEIDLIVLSQKFIYLIEVKNWTGILTPFDRLSEAEREKILRSPQMETKLNKNELQNTKNIWMQEKTYYEKGGIENKKYILHENMVLLNEKKRLALIRYFEDNNLKIDERKIVYKIVFVNSNLTFHESLAYDENLISFREIDTFVGGIRKSNFVENVVSGLIGLLVSKENSKILIELWYQNFDKKTFGEIDDILRKIRTWDYIKLYGDRILAGDCYYISGVNMDSEFLTESGEKIDKNHALLRHDYKDGGVNLGTVFLFTKLNANEMIEFRWCRSKFWGLIKALFGARLSGKHPFLGTTGLVKFHKAGENKAGFIELYKIEAILRG